METKRVDVLWHTFILGAIEVCWKGRRLHFLALSIRPLCAIWLLISKNMSTHTFFSNTHIFGIKKERLYCYLFFIRLFSSDFIFTALFFPLFLYNLTKNGILSLHERDVFYITDICKRILCLYVNPYKISSWKTRPSELIYKYILW